ncbi:MAG: hypothetical protein ABFS03_00855 [Chloroflexota bacterium]
MTKLNSIRKKYLAHRRSAKNRGIEFNLTIEELLSVWKKSGKWNKTGAKRKAIIYFTKQNIMNRFDDDLAEYKNKISLGQLQVGIAVFNEWHDSNAGKNMESIPNMVSTLFSSMRHYEDQHQLSE